MSKKIGIKPLKQLGQHFLVDTGVIYQIVQHILSVVPVAHTLVEVGPGCGALTDPMLRSGRRLSVIEQDTRCIAELRKKSGCSVYHEDALRFNFLQHLAFPCAIVGNLPYHISVALLTRLLPMPFSAMIFMVQKEVAMRLTALAGSRAYGRLSLLSQYYCHCEALFDIGPEAFYPKPKVTSTLVHFSPRTERPLLSHPDRLEYLTRVLFSQRRKQLRHTLSRLRFTVPITQLEVCLTDRPESLDLQTICRLANLLLLNE